MHVGGNRSTQRERNPIAKLLHCIGMIHKDIFILIDIFIIILFFGK